MKLVVCAVLLILAAGPSTQQQVTMEVLPAVIVKTEPKAGSTDVDPACKEIRITFSKDMDTRSMSWVQVSKESFPEIAGEVKFLEDERTCVAPVTLRPGTTYAMWLNGTSGRNQNFRDEKGTPAVPYLLAFETKDEAP